MRAQEFITCDSINERAIKEYEKDTPRAQEIEKVLSRAGYKQLGTGNEATVWARTDGPVIKVIMPGSEESTSFAMDGFKRFYKLTKKKSSPHWPKYIPMRDEAGKKSEFAEFTIGDRKYVQIAIEKLLELSPGEAEIVEDMANAVESGKSLKQWGKEYMSFYQKEYPKEISNIQPQLSSLWDAMILAYKVTDSDYLWDLHGSNAMKRQNGTIVITDPFIHWAI